MNKNFLLHFLRNFGLIILCCAGMEASATATPGMEIRHHYKLPPNATPADFEAQTIIMKLLPEYRFILNNGTSSNAQVQKVLDQLQANTPDRIFKNATPPESQHSSWGEPMVDLTLIYQLKYKSNIDIETAINSLLGTGVFQYVEPNFIAHTTYTPNDPDLATKTGQYFIKRIKADSAWNVIKGDTNVVIGIVDSGTDPDHPDLINNIKYNYADPINGIDDDGDGYIDNYRGWDLSGTQYSNGDPNPTVGVDAHGSHVSGCAAASTDNGIGMASPGFLCKFLPVKAAYDSSGGAISFPNSGIVYAADHECQIINCSFGSIYYSDYGKDAVNYASINKNALVVASAGNNGQNSNAQSPEYPSGYEHALSVAATTSTDAKASFSSYGPWVGISAPGNSIYSNCYSTHNQA